MRTEELSPLRVAYKRHNRDLDPQLVWRGRDEQDWSDLEVHAPPLYIQEKLHPTQLTRDGLSLHEIGIFVRSDDQLNRACKAAENAKLPYKIIDYNMTISSGHIAIGNMHIAKGLEFRAVVVMVCDD
jgi:hypothetical protein